LNSRDTRISAEETIALLEETLEATHDGLLVLDLDRRILRYNRQFIRMFGLTAEEIDRNGMQAVAAALSTQVEDAGRLLVNLADPWIDPSVEVLDTLRFKDGRVFERFIAPYRHADRVIGRVASYRDVTETVGVKQALEQQRAFLEEAQRVAHIGSWVADLETHRLDWSVETCRIFGVDHEKFSGNREEFISFVHPDDREMVISASRRAIRDGTPVDIEHRAIRPDGTVRWVHHRGDITRDANGKSIRMVGTAQDVTERRTLEEQLRQSQKLEAIGQLAGGIAHDLNNSLTAIMGFTELALGVLSSADPARPDVLEIRHAASRAASVTRQLLAFSRKQMLEPCVFSLSESVASLGRMIGRILGPSIELTTTAPEGVPSIYGDPGQIEQAILNIAVNARDAMESGGSLSLVVSEASVDDAFAQSNQPMPPGSYVEVRVTDTGHGMDEATKARIFEPFFTTKEVGKGTGLGLSMVYGTVRQTGGYIFVDSEPGKGATFRMYFPPARGDHAIPTPTSAAHPGTATILVVEDEPAVRTIVMTALRRKGHRVIGAASAEEALAAVETESGPIDLLLTDVSMPGMNGIALAQELAPKRPDMIIVVMSGFTEDNLKLRDAGIPAILLPKPFTPTVLQRTIAGLLAGRSSARS
jgi:two-component system, cell cycle sensor histidine kinase and response regulator CckA